MKPVYFPFTYINDADARNLCDCFGQLTVYHPVANKIPENMQKLSNEGVIDIKVPVSGDEERILALIKEYEEWGEIHQKSDTAFLKAIGERVPFFDETYSSELASQVKKIRDENYSKESPNILFNARLFLCLAHDYDIMQDGINRDLIAVYEMEKKLLAGLTHEDELFFTKNTGEYLESDDPGRYKIKERIEAWAYLMSKDVKMPRFFVTCNRDAFDFVAEKSGDPANIIKLPPVPISSGIDVMNKSKGIFLGQIEDFLKYDNFKVNEKIFDLPAVSEPESEIFFKISGIGYKSRRDFMNSILNQDFQDDAIDDKSEINKSVFISLCETSCST